MKIPKEHVLIYPKIDSQFNNDKIKKTLILKVKELLGGGRDIKFILLSGQLIDTKI